MAKARGIRVNNCIPAIWKILNVFKVLTGENYQDSNVVTFERSSYSNEQLQWAPKV
jgi:hypothetical protein